MTGNFCEVDPSLFVQPEPTPMFKIEQAVHGIRAIAFEKGQKNVIEKTDEILKQLKELELK